MFCAKEKCNFYLNPCLKASIESEIVLGLLDCNTDIWTEPSLKETALFVITDVHTLSGSVNRGTKQQNSLVGALLYRAKTFQGSKVVVLSCGHPTMQKFVCSHPSMMDLTVFCAQLIPYSDSITDKKYLYKQHQVLLYRVHSRIELQHYLELMKKDCEVHLGSPGAVQ